MKQLNILLLTMLFVLVSAGSPPPFTGSFNEVLDSLYSGNYQYALNATDSIITEYPDSPAGHYLKVGIYSAYMSDFETDTLKDSLMEYAERILEYSGDSAYDNFFKASALFQLSSFRAMQEDYIGALRYSKRSADFFNKTLRQDSTLYDAYLGQGIINYFTNKFRSRLPFFRSPDNGIADIRRAAQKGLFSYVPAYSMLAMLYMMDSKTDSALIYIDSLRQDYPCNRMFMYTHYKIYYEDGQYSQALNVLRQLMDRVEETQAGTYSNLIYVYYNTGLVFHEMNMDDSASVYLKKALDYRDTAADNKSRENIRKARQLYEKIR
ncbi:MAG: tetratricopeptide repeat protein [bacterium]